MPKSTMKVDVNKIFRDALVDAKLDESGRDMAEQIYQMTLARFERKARRKGKEVWDVDKFVRFVTKETEKIAAAAEAAAGRGGVITGPILNKVARKSMAATHKHCHMRLNTKGDIVGFTHKPLPPIPANKPTLIGDICSTYLESEV